MLIVYSPSLSRSADALKHLPISLEISCDLPFREFSRELLGEVDPGNMEYSAVIHPLFCPARNEGTPSSKLAEQSTFVLPVDIVTEPSENASGLISISTGRNSRLVLSSVRILFCGFMYLVHLV